METIIGRIDEINANIIKKGENQGEKFYKIKINDKIFNVFDKKLMEIADNNLNKDVKVSFESSQFKNIDGNLVTSRIVKNIEAVTTKQTSIDEASELYKLIKEALRISYKIISSWEEAGYDKPTEAEIQLITTIIKLLYDNKFK
ncbi:MAG: hypothetical protein ACTSVX_05975 [Promethearchaeota archaeon]